MRVVDSVGWAKRSVPTILTAHSGQKRWARSALPTLRSSDNGSYRNLLNSPSNVSRSLASSGASVSLVIASAFGAAFSAIC
jgi:hypothetical protein